MSKIVIANPGEIARAVDHDGQVTLDDLHKHLGGHLDREVTVDVRRLGVIPSGAEVDMWFDDEGLLWDDSLPNRELPNGTVICGPLLVCATDGGGGSIPLDDDAADFVVRDINSRWQMLSPDSPKPEPEFKVYEVSRG